MPPVGVGTMKAFVLGASPFFSFGFQEISL